MEIWHPAIRFLKLLLRLNPPTFHEWLWSNFGFWNKDIKKSSGTTLHYDVLYWSTIPLFLSHSCPHMLQLMQEYNITTLWIIMCKEKWHVLCIDTKEQLNKNLKCCENYMCNGHWHVYWHKRKTMHILTVVKNYVCKRKWHVYRHRFFSLSR